MRLPYEGIHAITSSLDLKSFISKHKHGIGRDKMKLCQLQNGILADTPTCIGYFIIATMVDTYILLAKIGPLFGCT